MGNKWLGGFDPNFLDAASACAWNINNASTADRDMYFQLSLRYYHYKYFVDLMSKLIASQNSASPTAVTGGQINTIAMSPLQFLYMDVGSWTGDGAPGWHKHREFGLVYGHIAILCTFGTAPSYHPCRLPWIDFNNKKADFNKFIEHGIDSHPDFPPIRGLLDNLNGASSIGPLHILGAATVSSSFIPVPSAEENDPILVFIGDLHAPVVTNRSNAHIIEHGNEMLRGRLRVPAFLQLLSTPDYVLTNLFQTLSEMEYNTSTSSNNIDAWTDLYHGIGGQRGAEIFQSSGQDLRTLVDFLSNYHTSSWPLEVFQLGDFFDLWIGFQRAFNGTIDNPLPCAQEFAKFWVERTLFSAGQGDHLTHFRTMSQTAKASKKNNAPLKTHFLYGNHDNYLKHLGPSIVVPHGKPLAGQKMEVFNADSHHQAQGIWCEHGHQSDTANRDADPTLGYNLTQAAYFQPRVRDIEGPASWTSAHVLQGDSNQLPRIRTIRRSIDICLLNHINSSNPTRGIYVMGHSHIPMLKRVQLIPRPSYPR